MSEPKSEGEESANLELKDCPLCYHPLMDHEYGVECSIGSKSCNRKHCCKHQFPSTPPPHYCVNCSEFRRKLSRCGHYHPEGVCCGGCATPIPDLTGKVMVLEESVVIAPTRRVQLVVLRNDGTYRYYPMSKYPGGWKIDPTSRTLIIGKGMGRKIIPLETIDHFSPEEY
jgi:hypothetical protein